MFKILSKNSKRVWKNSAHKIFTQCGAKTMFFLVKKIPKIRVTSAKGQKAQLHIPTNHNLCLKFQVKTPSGYGKTALTRFSHNVGQKTM